MGPWKLLKAVCSSLLRSRRPAAGLSQAGGERAGVGEDLRTG